MPKKDPLRKKIEEFIMPFHVIKASRTIGGISPALFTYTERNSVLAEQFNILRTNLFSLASNNPLHALLITSGRPTEGKSTTAANLAYNLSLDNSKKTILIDCDLRKPTLHTFFNMQPKDELYDIPDKNIKNHINNRGLRDIIEGNANIHDFIKAPILERLYFIPSGTPMQNPSRILDKEKLRKLINELKTIFDFIIIDSPPVLAANDARILGSVCDGVILVIKAEATPSKDIMDTFNALKSASAEPKGYVLTNLAIKEYDRYGEYYRS